MSKKNMHLLSYPRSGNTWMRYILEFFSKRPSNANHHINQALGAENDIGVDLKAPYIVHKEHKMNYDNDHPIIVLVRNYKEALTRHAIAGGFNNIQKKKNHFLDQTQGRKSKDVDYIDVVETYDIWKGPKILIYYEDLIQNPKVEIARVLEFAEIPKTHWDDFFNNFEKHSGNSIKSYKPGSMTKGSNLYYHSKNLPNDYIKFMDNHLKTKYPELFEKYLKRYL